MCRKSGFTLIELLVVISIIAILASMLMSAIGLVRASARNVGCSSNLRQLGTAMLAYTNDNDGYVMTGEWHVLMQAMLDDSFATCLKVGRCPAVPALSAGGVRISTTYAYTGVYWPSWTAGTPNDPARFLFAWPTWLNPPHRINLAQLQRSAEKCLISERWDHSTSVLGDVSWGVNLLNDQATNLVHGTGANFLFSDGHVQAVPVTGIERYSSIQWAADPMWQPYDSQASAYVR